MNTEVSTIYPFSLFRSRGLGQLLRAKKIHTIGDLASLSEYDIHNLPVRSPKVSNVKTVLTNFKQQQDAKKKCANTSISEIMAAVATAHTSANTASCELNLQSIKEKVNRKCIVAVIENPKTKSPENMGISPTGNNLFILYMKPDIIYWL